jgi:hypothetical protein
MIGKTVAHHQIITKLKDLATEVMCRADQIRTNHMFAMALLINQFAACSCGGCLGGIRFLHNGLSRKGLV